MVQNNNHSFLPPINPPQGQPIMMQYQLQQSQAVINENELTALMTQLKVTGGASQTDLNPNIQADQFVDGADKLDNYFMCSVCISVVWEPVQCGQCERWFCQGCMDQWLKRESSCPNCKSTFQKAAKPSMFAYNKLKESLFNCQKCTKPIKYKDMANHVISCGVQALVSCPQQCLPNNQKAFRVDEIEQHLRFQCPKTKLSCQKCQGQFERINQQSHDCVQFLLVQMGQLKQENQRLVHEVQQLRASQQQSNGMFQQQQPQYQMNGMNGFQHQQQSHQFACQNNHLLQFMPIGSVPGVNSCDSCIRRISKADYFYRCHQCDFDLCRKCSTCKHGHILTLVSNHPNGIRLNNVFCDKCKNGVSTPFWHCSANCDWDICKRCLN